MFACKSHQFRYPIALCIGLFAANLALGGTAVEQTPSTLTITGVAHEVRIPAGLQVIIAKRAAWTDLTLTGSDAQWR
jgi:hypothetical protein